MQSPGSAGAARLWRPAAQRHVRNAWAAMHAERAAWASASAASFQTASALVNLSLSRRFIATMDLGVLQDMDAICQKARAKMGRQQEGQVAQLLTKFDDQVKALSNMLQASKEMRAYRSEDGPLIMFSNEPSVEGDTGDGAGAPVFATLPISIFEKLAEEIVAMFETELKLKWLLTSEFRALVYPKALPVINFENIEGCDQFKSFSGTASRSGLPDLLAKSEFINLDWNQVGDILKVRSKEEVQRETYQVYLTALLIEVNIDKQRIEEIVAMINDEMTGRPAVSPA
ncbi:hypothetical protein M758_2G085100 [Ceratodon purpureus]|nr:hypothetical protein M758_2G085100 [Ceratodon purpureus]